MLAPVSPAVTGAQEARIFLLGDQLVIPIVQTSEPGPLSVITGTVN